MSFAYAHLCALCPHMLSEHLWSMSEGSLVDGPYRCLHCPCSVGQDAACTRMSRRQFHEWLDAGGTFGARGTTEEP